MTAATKTSEKDTGDVLLEQGKLNAAQLEQVRRRQKRLSVSTTQGYSGPEFRSSEQGYMAGPWHRCTSLNSMILRLSN